MENELLKQLAFMWYNDEEYFILFEGEATTSKGEKITYDHFASDPHADEHEAYVFEGNYAEARAAWEKELTEIEDADTHDNFVIFCQNNYTEVTEFSGDDYLVLTDEEADEKAKEYILDSVWAFNADFIIDHSEVLDHEKAPQQIVKAIAEQCESGNDAMKKLIDDEDEFVEAAISADGRGHFMSSYDGNEDEVTVKDEYDEQHTFYIYRLN